MVPSFLVSTTADTSVQMKRGLSFVSPDDANLSNTEASDCSVGTLSGRLSLLLRTDEVYFRKTDGPSAPAFSASIVDLTSALLVAGLLLNVDCSLTVSTCPAYDTADVLRTGCDSNTDSSVSAASSTLDALVMFVLTSSFWVIELLEDSDCAFHDITSTSLSIAVQTSLLRCLFIFFIHCTSSRSGKFMSVSSSWFVVRLTTCADPVQPDQPGSRTPSSQRHRCSIPASLFHAIQLIAPHQDVLQHSLARPPSQWTCSCLPCLVSSHHDLNTQRSLSSLAEQLCRPRFCRLVATATFRSGMCGLRLSCTWPRWHTWTDIRFRSLSTPGIPSLLWWLHRCGLLSVRRSWRRSNLPLRSKLHSVHLFQNFGWSFRAWPLFAEEGLDAWLVWTCSLELVTSLLPQVSAKRARLSCPIRPRLLDHPSQRGQSWPVNAISIIAIRRMSDHRSSATGAFSGHHGLPSLPTVYCTDHVLIDELRGIVSILSRSLRKLSYVPPLGRYSPRHRLHRSWTNHLTSSRPYWTMLGSIIGTLATP